MPTKNLESPFGRDGITPRAYKFGGGANTVTTEDGYIDEFGVFVPYNAGYIINAGGGNDNVTGSSNDDTIIGGSGADTITGGGGNDTLTGGTGSDSIIGGAGDDIIYGGEQDGTDGGSRKDSTPSNELIGDTWNGGVADSLSATFGSDTITGGDGVDNFIYGDNFGALRLDTNSSFTGGKDILSGGNGLNGEFVDNVIIGDSQFIATSTGSGASFTGGDDILTGGSGVNVSNELVGDVGSVGNVDTFQGGNDTLISGEFADDIMRGDWSTIPVLYAGNAMGGEDTFVFGLNNGNDRITDFRSTDSDGFEENDVGDTIDLVATSLTWTDLDGVGGNSVLDNADAFVSIVTVGEGEDAVTSTVIDLGWAVNGELAKGIDLVTVEGVTGLVETDFDFMTVA